MSTNLISAARAALQAWERDQVWQCNSNECQQRMDNLRTAMAAAEAQPNLACKSVQARLAAQWGYVQAQPVGEPVGEVVIGEEGMTKDWTVIRWRADLPPIAVGMKLYTTQPAAPEWVSRFHHLMKKHGLHPGRTDDDLLEILDAHLSAATPAQPAAPAPLTDEQIAALVFATVYDGDCSTPYRDAWAAEIGVPFARAIERAHGIGEGA